MEGVLAYIEARKKQQITLPLDEASQNIVSDGTVEGLGDGTAPLTQSVFIGSTPTSISVPAPFVKSVRMEVNGLTIEVPSLI